MQYRVLGNLVEHYAAGLFRLQVQGLPQMPGDGLSLTVLIGCEPDHGSLVRSGLKLGHHFLLVRGHLVLRNEAVLYVYTQIFLGQITDVTVARTHCIFLSQYLFDGLRLSRRLYDY